MTFQASHQPPSSGSDEFWMQQALAEAEKAYSIGEVPVGAVIVADNKCIGKGHNKSIIDNDPSAHAEVVAIRDASRNIENYRITNSTIYVTLEPCLMCIGAIIHARITKVVFSASDPKTGVLRSQINCCELPFINHVPLVEHGVLEEESSSLLKKFFKEKRSKK